MTNHGSSLILFHYISPCAKHVLCLCWSYRGSAYIVVHIRYAPIALIPSNTMWECGPDNKLSWDNFYQLKVVSNLCNN